MSLLLLLLPLGSSARENSLEAELGRSEVRVLSAALPLVAGLDVDDLALPSRLDHRGYRRVHERPTQPGEYFWGADVFWIYRRAHRLDGRSFPAALFALTLENGKVTGGLTAGGTALALSHPGVLWLEPVTLAESLDGHRAVRRQVRLRDLPEHVWRPVLAAEDHRFFTHTGLDGRAIARALLADLGRRGVAQGGSTITQQLVKNRDLTPRRTLGRKASEAVRALMLEAEHDKREILEAYLDTVYLGHLDGEGIYGLGTAAQAYFSRPARDLDLSQAALLAGMIHSPNRLSPVRHPAAAQQRRDWVLGRLQDLGWASADAVAAARERGLELRLSPPQHRRGTQFLSWVDEVVRGQEGKRLKRGRGVVVETTLDPLLQERAEEAVAADLESLRRRYPKLAGAPLGAALVALDAASGDVLAYVGGPPNALRGGFDRARQAARQPGSLVKPFTLLEAFEDCGERSPLYPASRVEDRPLVLDLPTGAWRPADADGRFRGTVTVRRALAESLNVPFVRIARWCGFRATARRFRRAGLELPDTVPPAFSLGAVEETPLALARAYSAIADAGVGHLPRPVRRVETPGGRRLHRFRTHARRVVSAETAYLVRDLLQQAARSGTARAAALPGLAVAAKTGTSSERRDAWLAGFAGGVVTVVWVGRDDGLPLGLTGSQAAAPLWRRFMAEAAQVHGRGPTDRPAGIVVRYVDEESGLIVGKHRSGAVPEIFRRGAMPRRHHWWRRDRPVPSVN